MSLQIYQLALHEMFLLFMGQYFLIASWIYMLDKVQKIIKKSLSGIVGPKLSASLGLLARG